LGFLLKKPGQEKAAAVAAAFFMRISLRGRYPFSINGRLSPAVAAMKKG
jgi:hypothetical protein